MTKYRRQKNASWVSGERCHYCGEPATTVDHVMPRAVGGRDARWNLVPSCGPCNWSRGHQISSCRCVECATKIRAHRKRYLSNPQQYRGMVPFFRAYGIVIRSKSGAIMFAP